MSIEDGYSVDAPMPFGSYSFSSSSTVTATPIIRCACGSTWAQGVTWVQCSNCPEDEHDLMWRRGEKASWRLWWRVVDAVDEWFHRRGLPRQLWWRWSPVRLFCDYRDKTLLGQPWHQIRRERKAAG